MTCAQGNYSNKLQTLVQAHMHYIYDYFRCLELYFPENWKKIQRNLDVFLCVSHL